MGEGRRSERTQAPGRPRRRVWIASDARAAWLRGVSIGGLVRAALRAAWFCSAGADLSAGPHAVIVGGRPTLLLILMTCVVGEGVPAAAGLAVTLARRPTDVAVGAAGGLGMAISTAAGTALSLWADGEQADTAIRAIFLGPDVLGLVPCATGAILASSVSAGRAQLAVALAVLVHATSAFIVAWRPHLRGLPEGERQPI